MFRSISCILCGAALACGSQPSAVFSRASEDLVVPNGQNLNGQNLNGQNLNGSSLGSQVVAVSFAGALVHGGVELDAAWLDGTVFYGTQSGAVFSGWQFRRARFVGTTDNGSTVTLRIDGITQEDWPDDDVWEYFVSYQDPASSDWSPLCTDAQGNLVPAIPVNGRWNYGRGVPGGGGKIDDPSSFTFACKGLGAIAKCVFPIGYKPWKSVNGVSLDRLHQACVRLIRADFCGDGTPYTVNGQKVDLYDGIGVQGRTENWLIEAEWDENGARCFNPKNRSHAFVPCFLDRAVAVCGAPIDFQLGALLMDDTPLPLVGSLPLLPPL